MVATRRRVAFGRQDRRGPVRSDRSDRESGTTQQNRDSRSRFERRVSRIVEFARLRIVTDCRAAGPRSAASATACARLSAPSLLKMAVTWNLTVRSEIESVSRDLAVGLTGGDQAQHAALASAQQTGAAARLGHALHELRGDPRAEVRLAGVNLPNRLRDLRRRRSLQQVAPRPAPDRPKHVVVAHRTP